MTEQVVIVLSAIVFAVAGLSARRLGAKSIIEFSTRRDSLSWFVTAAGVSMTFVGGAALVNMSSLGYSFGWVSLVDPIAVSAGISISAVLIGKYRSDKGVTMAELLSSDYRPLSIYIGIITSTIFLLVTSAQYVAFSKLLAPYFPRVSPIVMMLIPSVVISIYVFLGGFAAVTKTDVIQLIFVIGVLVLPVGYFAIHHASYLGHDTPMAISRSRMPIDLMLLLCISVFYVPISQDMNIRAKSAKTGGAGVIGFLCGALFYSVIVSVCIYMGIILAKHGVNVGDSESAFTTFFKQFFPSWGVLAVLAGMAAIWSTLDTYLMNTITSFAQDVVRKSPVGIRIRDSSLIVGSGLVVFVAAMLIALYFFKVLELILTALLIYISVLIPVAFGRKMKIPDRTVLVFSLVITGMIIVCEWLKLPVNPKAIIYPLSGVGIMIVVRSVTLLRQQS